MLGLDNVVQWSRAWHDAVGETGEMNTLDESGKIKRSTIHDGWGAGGFTNLVGRVADLKTAYKQLPLHPAHRCFCVIAVLNPSTGKPE
eukprot:9327730-Karenia_brevis.AAC.1